MKQLTTLLVYPVPPVLPTNPYLDLLYASMPGWIHPCRMRVRRELLELVRGGKPALLHLHFFDELCQRPGRAATAARTLGFLGLLRLLGARGVPLVWTAHNAMPHETFHERWAARAYASVARQSAAIIAHSHAAAHELTMRYAPPRPPFVVPHGNYVGLAGPAIPRCEARRALGLDEDLPVLLALGTLRPYKGLESLLDAFAALPPGTAQLLIAGGAKVPSYAAALARQVERTPGARLVPRHLPEAELPLYLGAAGLVILPYRHLLTSGILLWAMSYARPVVAPAFGAVAELVRDGQEGFLYPPTDPAALPAALERALAHPDLAGLGQAALERVQPFTWPRVAAQTALVYAEAAMKYLD
jgi:beta-1,4-mannosyltransferase